MFIARVDHADVQLLPAAERMSPGWGECLFEMANSSQF
jgi:hypothetical protein